MVYRVSFFSLALLCSVVNQVASAVHHITTNSASTYEFCTAPCSTLSEFAANLIGYVNPNTTLAFLPGTHYLTLNLSISNTSNFSVTSNSEGTSAIVNCRNHSNIHFENSQYISISNLMFIGCGGNQVEHVENFIVKHTKFEGQNASGTALEIIKTTAQIVNSTFKFNKRGTLKNVVVSINSYRHGISLDSRHGFAGGAIIASGCKINISLSTFENNEAKYGYGGAIFAEQHSIIIIHNSSFTTSSAYYGGAVFSLMINVITIIASEFYTNTAEDGGVLYSLGSNITIKESRFYDNFLESSYMYRDFKGGVMYTLWSNVIIETSKFYDNIAIVGSEDTGGALHSDYSIITIEASDFHSNAAFIGGVLYSESSTITIDSMSEFNGNTAFSEGGVLFSNNSTITIVESNSTVTVATCSIDAREGNMITNTIGEIVCTKYVNLSGFLRIMNNKARRRRAVIYLRDSELNVGHLILSDNVGSLFAFNSNISFVGCVKFVNNHPEELQSSIITDELQEGGAITLFQSNAYFNGNCSLQCNRAINGGGLLSLDSKLYVNGDVAITQNTAIRNGGGVYLSNSELICLWKSSFRLNHNLAQYQGGGLHAISSTIKAISAYDTNSYIGARMIFTKNMAGMGGGLSLEANAKLYVLKYDYDIQNCIICNTTVFKANTARSYGGAVYVNDDTNTGTCTSTSRRECFFQVLALHTIKRHYYNLRTQSLYFSQNQANISGSTLYGGLLDRCAVSQFAEVRYKIINRWSLSSKDFDNMGAGQAYFKNVSVPTYYHNENEISIATNISISSDPVKVCLCNKNKHNCSHQTHVEVKKGGKFNISLVAVDQIEQPVAATIHASLKYPQSGLSEGQLITDIQGECTNLTFNVVSPQKFEILTLYAVDGPCKDADLSRREIRIEFLPCSCPIGFQITGKIETNCTCDCHSSISQYTEYCDSHTGSFVKQSSSRAWISYINNINRTGYVVYKNCPFNYCNSVSLPIDLNQPGGADIQCAFNRSSLLCGSCQPGLSLSLGSSCCLKCPSYWLILLAVITIAAVLAGIVLVALLLVLNMTVAVGTLNGLIFYANIVYANKNILLPFQETNTITVFISLLNLDLGIDACYFPGMDAYTKTWLQLAFPAFVFYLVGLVIAVSSYSIRFSKLIGNKDPVATLATLILLSYAKLLQICFQSLSVGILTYPDGTNEPLWLPDATVKYLSGKHIPLFLAAVLILMVGLIYIALLFSWQWHFYLRRWKIFAICLRNQKLQLFIETYHAPFKPKHRYWTGLLLIARAILYLVAAVNVSNDPQLSLSAIVFTMICILLLITLIDIKMYKKISTNFLETFFVLNILLFSIFTWYSLNNTNINQKAVAYTSVLTTFIILWFIILYHLYTYTTIISKVKKINISRMISRFLPKADSTVRARYHQRPPPDNNIHRFNELLDIIAGPVNTNDYNVPLLDRQPMEPTYSVVELPESHPDQPDPEEAIIRNIPGPA